MITLYKMDSLGRILYWRIYHEKFTVHTEWGVMVKDSAGYRFPMQSHAQTKQDTYSDVEYGIERMNADIKEQIARKGYSREIPKSVPFLPMRAEDWDDRVDFESFAIQPKLDGYRCIASKKELRSRLNEVIRSVPHINEALQSLPEGVHLDGELYIHGADLQTISSYVKRGSPHASYKLVEYHVFDVVMLDTPYSERYETQSTIFRDLVAPHVAFGGTFDNFPVKFVPTAIITSSTQENKDYIKRQHDGYRNLGYEGLIIRDLAGLYELNKRSKSLRKYKEFIDDEFQIINIEEGAEGCAVLVCKTGNTTTDVALAFTKLRKQAIWQQRENYIGRWARVKFQRRLPSGKLFQPTCTDIRTKREDFHA